MHMQVIDAAFLQLTVSKTLQRSASVHLLFAFEYVIQVCNRLTFALHQPHPCTQTACHNVIAGRLNMINIMQASVVLSTAGKYTLAMIDAAMEGRWASKGTYVFYLELVTDMLHLFVYLIFFIIVFANYGLPLHLVRYGPVCCVVTVTVICQITTGLLQCFSSCHTSCQHAMKSRECYRRCGICTGHSATSETGSPTFCATAASLPTWMSGADTSEQPVVPNLGYSCGSLRVTRMHVGHGQRLKATAPYAGFQMPQTRSCSAPTTRASCAARTWQQAAATRSCPATMCSTCTACGMRYIHVLTSDYTSYQLL